MEDPDTQQRVLTDANKRVMQEAFLMKRATVRGICVSNWSIDFALACPISKSNVKGVIREMWGGLLASCFPQAQL